MLLMVKAKKRKSRTSSMREKHLLAIVLATASNSCLNVFRFRCRMATLFVSDKPVWFESTSRCACRSAKRSMACCTVQKVRLGGKERRDRVAPGEKRFASLTFFARQHLFLHLVRKPLVIELGSNVVSVSTPSLHIPNSHQSVHTAKEHQIISRTVPL